MSESKSENVAHVSSEAQSLAGALNEVIDNHAELAATRSRLFSFTIKSKLPTWVTGTDLEVLKRQLSEALEKDLNDCHTLESQVECRLDDGSILVFVSRDPHNPKDRSRVKELLTFKIEPAHKRETFSGLLSQSRGSSNLGNIKTLLRGLNFLLVDDSPDNLEIECALITDLGGDADSAHDGEEAIAKALSGNYDLVLMDIQMPVMDGNQAMKKLLAEGYKVPVIAVSALSSIAEREDSFACGFSDYITKPFQPDQLIRTILRLTKRPIPIASKSRNGHSVRL